MPTYRSWIAQVLFPAAVALLLAAGPSLGEPYDWDSLPRGGGIVVDHQPIQTGGPASDTEHLFGGEPSWQLLADELLLSEAATIRRVNWWGFYYYDNPPATETMRVRFYDARPGDALPGNVLFEESFLNPSRTATGEIIGAGGLPAEYLFEVDLTTPMLLEPDVPYWFEAVQVGDIDTTFRWEFSAADINGHAFINNNLPDWQHTTSLMADLAFQLSTVPEPGTLGLCLVGIILLGRRSRKEARMR